ncbi:MAG: hypothetical protein WAO35_01830 [Terriglobia bacterium]
MPWHALGHAVACPYVPESGCLTVLVNILQKLVDVLIIREAASQNIEIIKGLDALQAGQLLEGMRLPKRARAR